MMFEWIKKKFRKKRDDSLVQDTDFLNDYRYFKKNLKNIPQITDDLLQSFQILLIQSDISLDTVIYLMTVIRNKLKERNITVTSQLFPIVYETILDLYKLDHSSTNNLFPSKQISQIEVYLFVGVNGVGKTTTIGKLAYKLKQQNLKVLLIAGDTFRSGAVDQLKIWAQRIKVDIFFKENAKKPSNVIFEGLQLAKEKLYDVVLCDTAGRLENKVNLMEELYKIQKVINKVLGKNPKETFLVLDAMMGQNGLKQVAIFQKSNPLTGVIITKLDGVAKGGLIFSIKHLYGLDIKYIGIGEQVEDLIIFDIQKYIYEFLKHFFDIDDNFLLSIKLKN